MLFVRSRSTPSGRKLALLITVALTAAALSTPEASAKPASHGGVHTAKPVAHKLSRTAILRNAAATARRTQHRVHIVSRDTESSTTYANSNGTFTDVLTGSPTRARVAGKLQRINTTLHRSGGRLEPRATTARVSLRASGSPTPSMAKRQTTSDPGAGSTPDVVNLDPPGPEDITMGYDAQLGAPSVAGDTATYALSSSSALVASALPNGFDEDVVLSSPQATQQTYRFPLTLAGGLTPKLSNGVLSISDSAGKQVAVSRPLQMWDTHRDTGGDPSNISMLDSSLSSTSTGWELDLTPDNAYLAATTTAYPVTIDPTITLDSSSGGGTWYSNGGTTSNFGDYRLLVGRPTSTSASIDRAYMSWDTSQFSGDVVKHAVLSLYQYDAGSCSPKNMSSYPTTSYADPDSSKVTVNASSNWSQQQAFNVGGGGCTQPNGYDAIDVTKTVNGWSTGAVTQYGVELRAGDLSASASSSPTTTENDATYFKRFCSQNSAPTGTGHCEVSSGLPSLTVTYDLPPVMNASSLCMSPTAGVCSETTSATPTFSAAATDADGDSLRYDFEVWGTDYLTHNPTSVVATGSSALVSGGAPGSWTITTALSPTTLYTYRVRAWDGAAYSTWSSWKNFTYVPPTAASVTVAVSGSAASVDWEPSTSSNVSSYLVTASPAATPASVQTTSTSAAFTGLSAGTAYSFSVAVCSTSGCAPGVVADSVDASPPSAPTLPTLVNGAASGTMTASWEGPTSAVDDQPNSVTGYTVSLLSAAGQAVQTVAAGPDDQAATFANIPTGSHYSASITATNSFGTGAAAATPTVVSGGSNPVVNLAVSEGVGVLTASWDTPVLAPASYVMSASPTADGASTSTNAAGTATTATLTGLQAGTDYTVSVTAVNSVASASATYPTPIAPEVAPTAVTGVSASGLGGALQVSWTSGTNVDYYDVNVLDSSGNVVSTTEAAPDDTSAVVTVPSDSTYSVQVVSQNDSGSTATASVNNASSTGTQDTNASHYSVDQVTPDFSSTHNDLTLSANAESQLQADTASSLQQSDGKPAGLGAYQAVSSEDTSADATFDDAADSGNDFVGCAASGRPNCSNTFYVTQTLDSSRLASQAAHERKMSSSTVYMGIAGYYCRTGASLFRGPSHRCVSYASIDKYLKGFLYHWTTSRPADGNKRRLVFIPFTSNGGSHLSQADQRTNAYNYVKAMKAILVPYANDINRASKGCMSGGSSDTCRNVSIVVEGGIDEENAAPFNNQHFSYSWNQELDRRYVTYSSNVQQWNNVAFITPSCNRPSCTSGGWRYDGIYGAVYGLASAYGFPQIYGLTNGSHYKARNHYAAVQHQLIPQYKGILWLCNAGTGYSRSPGASWDQFKRYTGQKVHYISRQSDFSNQSRCDA